MLLTNFLREIIFGTTNGIIGQLYANNTEVQRGWTISNEESQSGIQSTTIACLTEDGTNDIIVGRDDG